MLRHTLTLLPLALAAITNAADTATEDRSQYTVRMILYRVDPETRPPAKDSDHATEAANRQIERILQEPVSMVFEDMHLHNVAELIAKKYEIEIEIDERFVRSRGQEAAQSSQEDQRYVTDGMVRYLNLENVTVKQALDAMLRPLTLTYKIEDGVLRITTAASDAYRWGPETERFLMRLRNSDKSPEVMNDPGVLARPAITVFEGQRASIAIDDQRPIPYFERLEVKGDIPSIESAYHLKHHTEPRGIQASVTVFPTGDPGFVSIALDYNIAYVTGREPLDGVDLDVGKPRVISNKRADERIKLPLDTWTSVIAADMETEGAILAWLNVSRIPAERAAAAASPAGLSRSTQSIAMEGPQYSVETKAIRVLGPHPKIGWAWGTDSVPRIIGGGVMPFTHAGLNGELMELPAFIEQLGDAELLVAPRITVLEENAWKHAIERDPEGTTRLKLVLPDHDLIPPDDTEMNRFLNKLTGDETYIDMAKLTGRGVIADFDKTTITQKEKGRPEAHETVQLGTLMHVAVSESETEGEVTCDYFFQTRFPRSPSPFDDRRETSKYFDFGAEFPIRPGDTVGFLRDINDDESILIFVTVDRVPPRRAAAALDDPGDSVEEPVQLSQYTLDARIFRAHDESAPELARFESHDPSVVISEGPANATRFTTDTLLPWLDQESVAAQLELLSHPRLTMAATDEWKDAYARGEPLGVLGQPPTLERLRSQIPMFNTPGLSPPGYEIPMTDFSGVIADVAQEFDEEAAPEIREEYTGHLIIAGIHAGETPNTPTVDIFVQSKLEPDEAPTEAARYKYFRATWPARPGETLVFKYGKDPTLYATVEVNLLTPRSRYFSDTTAAIPGS